MRIILIIAAIIVVSLGLFLSIINPSKDAQVTNEEILQPTENNIPKGINLILMPHMYEALNDNEKNNLSKEFTDVLNQLGIVESTTKKINNSVLLPSRFRLRINQFNSLLTDTERTSNEVKYEITAPAESLDEKVASIIGQILILNELAGNLKESLKKTTFEKDSEELYIQTLLTLKKINDFKNNLIEAIKIDYNKPENKDIIHAFSKFPLNESEITSKYGEYDGRIFFNNIKKTKTQLEQQFGLK